MHKKYQKFLFILWKNNEYFKFYKNEVNTAPITSFFSKNSFENWEATGAISALSL